MLEIKKSTFDLSSTYVNTYKYADQSLCSWTFFGKNKYEHKEGSRSEKYVKCIGKDSYFFNWSNW